MPRLLTPHFGTFHRWQSRQRTSLEEGDLTMEFLRASTIDGELHKAVNFS